MFKWEKTKQQELEKYRSGGKLSIREYFIDQVLIMKSIISEPPEEDIIAVLMKHFDHRIPDARVQNVTMIREFASLLQKDTKERNVKIRTGNNSTWSLKNYYYSMPTSPPLTKNFYKSKNFSSWNAKQKPPNLFQQNGYHRDHPYSYQRDFPMDRSQYQNKPQYHYEPRGYNEYPRYRNDNKRLPRPITTRFHNPERLRITPM